MRLPALLLLLVACGDKDPEPVVEADVYFYD